MQQLVDTLMARCEALAGCSETAGELTRTFLSEAMRDAHTAVSTWMQAAGMQVHLDAAGNIIGRRESTQANARTLLIGSHLDTVKNAGKYDGSLGVLLGIALVEALAGTALPFHLEVLGFSEEEGVRFGVPFIGSRAVAGLIDNTLLALTDSNGISVRDAIRDFGLNPDTLAAAAYPPTEVLGYLEVHSEQALRLASKHVAVGVVSTIVGASRARLILTGMAGHAGTVPMAQRQDALTGAAAFVLEVETLANHTHDLVGTVGQLEVNPGAGNVVPGQTVLSLDVRHASDEVRLRAVATLKAKAQAIADARGLHLEWQDLLNQAAVPMNPALTAMLRQSAGDCPSLPSGAGHDAMILGAVMPAAMLFVRSPNGVSHHPDELVLAADVAVALDTILGFVKTLAAQHA